MRHLSSVIEIRYCRVGQDDYGIYIGTYHPSHTGERNWSYFQKLSSFSSHQASMHTASFQKKKKTAEEAIKWK